VRLFWPGLDLRFGMLVCHVSCLTTKWPTTVVRLGLT
jgi:hypothetical protein